MRWRGVFVASTLLVTLALTRHGFAEDTHSTKKGSWLAEKDAARSRGKGSSSPVPRPGAAATVPLTVRNMWTHESVVLPLPRLPAAPRRAKGALIPPPAPLPAPVLNAKVVDRFLRCHYTDEDTHEDPRLLSVVLVAAAAFKTTYAEVVSGYRAPKYNLMLRKKGHEVSSDSQHSHGNAVDFRLLGVKTKQLREFVKSLKLGGVGYYPISEFVHADVGPIRFWTAR